MMALRLFPEAAFEEELEDPLAEDAELFDEPLLDSEAKLDCAGSPPDGLELDYTCGAAGLLELAGSDAWAPGTCCTGEDCFAAGLGFESSFLSDSAAEPPSETVLDSGLGYRYRNCALWQVAQVLDNQVLNYCCIAASYANNRLFHPILTLSMTTIIVKQDFGAKVRARLPGRPGKWQYAGSGKIQTKCSLPKIENTDFSITI